MCTWVSHNCKKTHPSVNLKNNSKTNSIIHENHQKRSLFPGGKVVNVSNIASRNYQLPVYNEFEGCIGFVLGYHQCVSKRRSFRENTSTSDESTFVNDEPEWNGKVESEVHNLSLNYGI